MNVNVTEHDNHIHAALKGELDAKTSPPATEQILDAMRTLGGSHVVIDLADVTFMSSPGLRLLLTVYKQGEAGGVTVEVVNPQPGVEKVLRIAGFDRMMAISEDE